MSPSRLSLVEQYFQDIEDAKGLPAEVEKELAQRIQQGDEEALKELVQANLRFVVTVATQYQNSELPLSDLISIGNMGLIIAAKHFDGTRGFKFITYAVWWIRQAIQQALKEQHIVRLPINKIDELTRIKNVLSKLEQKLGHLPDPGEIAEELSVNPEDMGMLLRMAQTPVSLEALFDKDESDRCYRDLLPDDSYQGVEEIVSQEELKAEIQQALKTLTEQESQVLCMYFGLGGKESMTLEGIAVHFGRTRERIRQIKEKALMKLRSPAASKALREYALDEE